MTALSLVVRDAVEEDLNALARIWHDAWHDAHSEIAPQMLVEARTMRSFLRIIRGLTDIRAVGDVGAPVGFCQTSEAELGQLFVSAEVRGKGVAAALLEDAEAGFAARKVSRAHLFCLLGNIRAVRFYERMGWQRVGLEVGQVRTNAGAVSYKALRYEKDIIADPEQAA